MTSVGSLTRRMTWRDRVVTWRRWMRWEFWPAGLLYLPMVAWIPLLGLRYGSLTLFTAANPGIPAGGLVGESKSDILGRLSCCGRVPFFRLITSPCDPRRGRRQVERFLADHELSLPVVLKPDVGERGRAVQVIRRIEDAEAYFSVPRSATLVQAYVDGLEYGILYCRHPSESRGRIMSLARKRLPRVQGDGRRSLADLIRADSRARLLLPLYAAHLGPRLVEIPPAGQSVVLIDVATHCRGAFFQEGQDLTTDELVGEIEEVSRSFEGFFFGRFDVKSEDDQALRAGRFQVLELNGVASEPLHIYDARCGLLRACGTLMGHWRTAFEIGQANRRQGVRPMGLRRLAPMILKWLRDG